MITMEALARRLPMVARPREPCAPLDERVARLRSLAEVATPVTAATVLNQAALVASDAGRPGLARRWCHRQAATAARTPAGCGDRRAIEPLVNLARLRARAGDGDGAYAMVRDLYAGSVSGADVEIDGRTVPGERLRPLGDWLFSVLVADGVRALAVTGRWTEVRAELDRHRPRESPAGRQIAFVARLALGQPEEALALLGIAEPTDAWERAVHRCLAVLARWAGDRPSAVDLDALLDSYRAVEPIDPLALFRTRLGLTLVDAAGPGEPARRVLAGLVDDVVRAGDAYSAQELLAAGAGSDELAAMVRAAGLGGGSVPGELHDVVETALRALS